MTKPTWEERFEELYYSLRITPRVIKADTHTKEQFIPQNDKYGWVKKGKPDKMVEVIVDKEYTQKEILLDFISSILQETEDRVRGEMREKLQEQKQEYLSKLSKEGQIEKALLEDMKKHIEKQKDGYFDRNEILRWLDIWINAIK